MSALGISGRAVLQQPMHFTNNDQKQILAQGHVRFTPQKQTCVMQLVMSAKYQSANSSIAAT